MPLSPVGGDRKHQLSGAAFGKYREQRIYQFCSNSRHVAKCDKHAASGFVDTLKAEAERGGQAVTRVRVFDRSPTAGPCRLYDFRSVAPTTRTMSPTSDWATADATRRTTGMPSISARSLWPSSKRVERPAARIIAATVTSQGLCETSR